MFTSVLIANRGEIACRIARTAQAHGPAHHRGLFGGRRRRAACAAVRRGASRSARRRRRESYLAHRQADRRRARRRARNASIPGYGFLSENADFAQACARCRHRLRRPAAGGDPRHGAEGPRQGADGEGRRAGGARLSRRAAGAEIPQAEGLRDRLSGADQGGGRRRRQGHARGSTSHADFDAALAARAARGASPPSATPAC